MEKLNTITFDEMPSAWVHRAAHIMISAKKTKEEKKQVWNRLVNNIKFLAERKDFAPNEVERIINELEHLPTFMRLSGAQMKELSTLISKCKSAYGINDVASV